MANIDIPQKRVENLETTLSNKQDKLPNGTTGYFLQKTSDGVTWAEAGGSSMGKSIGEVYYSQSSSAQDNPGGLPLFTGETIANADQVYPDFYTWVANHSDLQISAANYTTALTTYGECPKYVIDTTNKTIRLPKLTNYVKMANTTDGVTQAEAGLPNITGDLTAINSGAVPTGAFQLTATGAGANYSFQGGMNFDASRSSAIYGNSNTVTPAHTTLYPWVCAYNAAIPASTAQAAQFQQALTGKADTNLDNLTDDAKIPVTNMLTGIYDTVDYTVVGSPTISDGIASGFSRNAYVKTASKLSYTSSDTVEINIRFQTGAELPASFVSIATTGEYDDAFIYTYAHYLYCNLNNSQTLGELYTDLETDSWYTVNLQYSSGTLKRYLYDNAGQLLASDTQNTTPNNFEQFVCWGTSSAATNAIDFNATYIKLNGVYWFIGRVTEINPAHLAMPSDVYDELTIPAVDGTEITMPADGYLTFSGLVGGANSVLGLNNVTTGLHITSNPSFTSDLFYGVTLPVQKGDVVRIGFFLVIFNDTTNPGYLRFVYANGSKHEHQGA